MENAAIKTEIWQLVKTINQAWTTDGKIGKLKEYFHKDMVALVPNNPKCLSGQEECFESWRAFATNAVINYFKEYDPIIQIYNGGKAAIAMYGYEGSFIINNQSLVLRGRDMMVFIKEDNRWQLVADQFSPMPQ